MTGPALTLGTAGHIDHGKTSLVRALTGVDTDRLPEERERGISIELGFARMELPSGRSLSVVDVPGHERFVRTMVAGATGIDLFLLVVAADDGVMPQTREHLAVLEQLEVPAGVVALTKTDLVGCGGDARSRRSRSRSCWPAARTRARPVVSVSAARGTGLDELRAQLDDAARAAPGSEPGSAVRRGLHVDRSFTLQGIGTVVTGTLWSGTIARGARGADRARRRAVRGCGAWRCTPSRGRGPRRDSESRSTSPGSSAARSSVATWCSTAMQRPRRDTCSTWRCVCWPGRGRSKRGARVHVHHGTRETAARVSPVEGERLEPGRRGLRSCASSAR